MIDPKKIQQFSLAANLMPNKGVQKVAGMADQFGQMQQMREAKQYQDARTTTAQNYAQKLNNKIPIPTMTRVDEMLKGIYPEGADPSIKQFYVDLIGKYGR